MAKGGRPPEINWGIINMVSAELGKGAYFDAACGKAGISKQTGYNYMRIGRAEKRRRERAKPVVDEALDLYVEFLDAVKRGDAEGESYHLTNIHTAGEQGQWQASAWVLERRWRKKWARQIVVMGSKDDKAAQEAEETVEFTLDIGEPPANKGAAAAPQPIEDSKP